MEQSYLIMDLRDNQYVPGLVTVDGAEVDWHEERILQVVRDWESNASDSVSAVPLSFARRPRDGPWTVVDDRALRQLGVGRSVARGLGLLGASGLRPERIVVEFLNRVLPRWFDEDQKQPAHRKGMTAARSARTELEGETEVIPSLFDEARERLETLLPRTLGPLLKTTLDHYSTVSQRLMLVDSGEIRDVLESRLGAYLEHNKIRVSVPVGFGATGGFALATGELHQACLPNEGATWVCRFDDSDDTRRYTWNGTQFICELVDTSRAADGATASHWKSAEQLERVGAAVLVLFWQDRLTDVLEERIDSLEGQLEEDGRLLDRLRAAYQRILDEGLAEGAGRWIRARTRR